MDYLLGAVDLVYEGIEKMRIEDCFFQGGCRKRWGDLATTDNPDRRFCDDCNKHVHLLHSIEQLEKARGEPICAAFLCLPKPGLGHKT